MTLVMDLGSWSTKVGLVEPSEETLDTNQKPCKVVQEHTLMGALTYHDPERVAKTSDQIRAEERIFGSDCWRRSSEYSVSPLIEQSEILSKANLEQFLDQTVCKTLGTDPESRHKLLLSQNLNFPRKTRLELAAFAFEGLGFANFQFTNNAESVLLSHGLLEGLVVDIGESSTSVSPIVHGYALPHAGKRNLLGGNSLEDLLIHRLQQDGVATLRTSRERLHVARSIMN